MLEKAYLDHSKIACPEVFIDNLNVAKRANEITEQKIKNSI